MNRLFNPPEIKPIPAGLYHLQSPEDQRPPYRIHLRLQPDGTGTLIVNAATVLHLNPTAAEYAFHFIKGTTSAAVAREVASRYRVSRNSARKDFEDFSARIQSLLTAEDLDPTAYLGFDRVAPHSASLTAPLRVDCALTYRLPAGSEVGAAPVKRVDRELTTDEWRQILDKTWQAGVPHVTFTGGEPTLRDDLVELIQHAETIGQVCGLITDGLRLADAAFLRTLLTSGLDHILMHLQPNRPESWSAIGTVMPEDIFVTVQLTVTRSNRAQARSHLERLASLGVQSLSLTFADAGIEHSELTDQAAALGLQLRSELPVPYSTDNPVSRETSEDAVPDGAGKTWLYVEPDGDVLPAQGRASEILGNMLRDSWERIYPPAPAAP